MHGLREEKRVKEALEYYERALEVASEALRPEIQYQLAQCHQDLDDSDQAILEYLKVVYLYPNLTEWATKAHLQVAWLLEREERWQEAEQIYEKISHHEGEEGTVAKNRLSWIHDNVK